jgi:hypothetical protein
MDFSEELRTLRDDLDKLNKRIVIAIAQIDVISQTKADRRCLDEMQGAADLPQLQEWSSRFRAQIDKLDLPLRVHRVIERGAELSDWDSWKGADGEYQSGHSGRWYIREDDAFRGEDGRLMEFTDWCTAVVAGSKRALLLNQIGDKSRKIIRDACGSLVDHP